MIQDTNIDWMRKRKYIPVNKFSGLGPSAFLGAGAVVVAEISTFGIGGARLEATSDEIMHSAPLPIDVDVTKPFRIRIHWTSASSTAADDATIRVRYQAKADQEALAAADTALDTAVAEDRLGAQYNLCKTPWGIINANTLTKDDVMIWEIMCTAADMTIASEYVYILGMEFEYTPIKCKGAGIGNTREAWSHE